VLELRRRAIRGGRIDTELTRHALIAEVPGSLRDQERDESLSDIHRESIPKAAQGWKRRGDVDDTTRRIATWQSAVTPPSQQS
jgi:hypothetical protein